jgi:two-component system sensor histidine kinase SenX3
MPVQVRLDDVVAAAVDNSAIDAAAKDITLVTRGDHDLEVFGSAEQIGAAVSNLVANAVHYSEGGSRVLVTTKSMGDTAQISVVDQGIGIPAREIDRIFERFYRVDPARHRSTGGTGLGLSIVKHVAATHGGDVSVWSVEGQGSTFTLTLPLSSQSSTRLAGPTAPVTVVAPRDTSGRRTTVQSHPRPDPRPDPPVGDPTQEVRR